MKREIQIGDLVRVDGNIWLVIHLDWSGAAELLRGERKCWAMQRQMELISASR